MKSLRFAPVAVFALLAPVAAQGSILPYLPKDTMLAFAAPDLPMSIGDFAKMPLAKMWAEEEVQNFLADVKEMAAKQYAEGLAQAKQMHKQGALPVDPDDLLKLRLNGGAFAMTRLEFKMGDFGPSPKIGIVAHLDFGESAPVWNKLIMTGLGMLEERAKDKIVRSESSIGDVKVMSFMPPAESGVQMGLNLAMVGNGLVLCTLADDMKEIVAAMNAKTPMLGATNLYLATAKHVTTAGAECEMFLRPEPMIDFALSIVRMGIEQGEMDGVDMEGVVRAVDAMGLRNLGAMSMASSYVDGKCVSRTYSSTGKPDPTVSVKTIDTSFLKWVPKDAVSFGAGSMNLISFYDTLVKGLQAYNPEFAKQTLGQLSKLEEQLGFKVRDDFFGSLGDHYIQWSMPMGSITSPPEAAFLMKVNNEDKLVMVLKNLAKLTNGMVEIEEGEKRGVKAYQVRVNYDPGQGMGMNPFDMIQPTFAFKGGYMVVGFTASDVKRVFQRMDREDDPKGDIRSNKEFAAVAGSIPAGVDSLSFTDWKSNFESLYQIGTGLLAFVPMGEDIPIDMSLLPDSGTLSKHLYASVGYTKTDALGSESVTVSPFGPEVGMLFGAALVAGFSAFGVMRTRGF
ncbi:MAG: hypothetical protein JNK15_03975 [Planctomycetes bacterium]|nr:hypothetical protein [Planctomycetota bacterium]